MDLTKKDLHSIFTYMDGNFYWKENRSYRVKKGDKAGSIDVKGYLQVRFNNHTYKVHRLVFLYHYGYIPEIIDHIDGNKLNNNIENLRGATPSESQCNRGLQKNNKTGIKGVYWCEQRQKWEAYCYHQRKKRNLGRYNTKEEAELVVKKYREIMHGKFTNHG